VRFQPLQVKRQLIRYILDGNFSRGEALPTIHTLARTFRVSPNTVQEAVHALAAEGLIKATRGRGLFVNSTGPMVQGGKRIGVVLSGTREYLKGAAWPGEVFQALQEKTRAARLTLVPCPLGEVKMLAIAEHIQAQKFAGLLLFELDSDSLIMELRELRLPMISVDHDAYRMGVSSVTFDNAQGAFDTTQHLIEQGHRHIVLLRGLFIHSIGNATFLSAVQDERVEGYRLAMHAAGLPVRAQEYRKGRKYLREHLLHLFGSRPAPTAVVCVEDWQAQVVAEELQMLGFRIPEDLSIVGFGDSGHEVSPGRKLTSVAVDMRAMGEEAARLLLNAVQGNGAAPERMRLPTRLVRHGTVCAPAQVAAVASPMAWPVPAAPSEINAKGMLIPS